MKVKAICILSILSLLSISHGTIAATLSDEIVEDSRTPTHLKNLTGYL